MRTAPREPAATHDAQTPGHRGASHAGNTGALRTNSDTGALEPGSGLAGPDRAGRPRRAPWLVLHQKEEGDVHGQGEGGEGRPP